MRIEGRGLGMKKQIISLGLAILMLLTFNMCYADSEAQIVFPEMLMQSDWTLEEWCSDSDKLHVFAIAALVDCLEEWNDEELEIFAEATVLDSIYVAVEGESLSLWACGISEVLLFSYDIESKIGGYLRIDSEDAYRTADSVLGAMKLEGSINEYYKLEGDLIKQVVESMTNE